VCDIFNDKRSRSYLQDQLTCYLRAARAQVTGFAMEERTCIYPFASHILADREPTGADLPSTAFPESADISGHRSGVSP
jgi:hypothetical protein